MSKFSFLLFGRSDDDEEDPTAREVIAELGLSEVSPETDVIGYRRGKDCWVPREFGGGWYLYRLVGVNWEPVSYSRFGAVSRHIPPTVWRDRENRTKRMRAICRREGADSLDDVEVIIKQKSDSVINKTKNLSPSEPVDRTPEDEAILEAVHEIETLRYGLCWPDRVVARSLSVHTDDYLAAHRQMKLERNRG